MLKTKMIRPTVCKLVAVLIYVPSVFCGILSIGRPKDETIVSVECLSSADTKLVFVRETDNTSHTIAECKTVQNTCYLLDQSLFGKYFSVSYTDNGTLFNVVNDAEETRGTYYCCDLFSPTECVQLEINSTLINATKNNTDDNNYASSQINSDKPPYATAAKAIAILIVFEIVGMVIYILKMKKVCQSSEYITSQEDPEKREMLDPDFTTQTCQDIPSQSTGLIDNLEDPEEREMLDQDMRMQTCQQTTIQSTCLIDHVEKPEEKDILNAEDYEEPREPDEPDEHEYIKTDLKIIRSDKKQKQVEEEDWFFGVMPREEIEPLLVHNGDFLVRKSIKNANLEQYVLSAFWKGHRHVNIHMIENGWAFEEDVFPTISELVNHHIESEKRISNFKIILSNPIKRKYWTLNNDDIQLDPNNCAVTFDGEIKGSYKCTVTVKKCLEPSSKEQRKRFLDEGLKLQQYDHPNIVRFIGIAAQRQPVMIIMEYMSEGTLWRHLIKIGLKQSRKQAANMCLDVAKGMVYLSEKGCLHRKLSAENCLVRDDGVVKISAFGLSKLGDKYTVSEQMMPWTPPDAIKYGTWTSKCDVWSYGILMWEVFSNGLQPYVNCTNVEIRETIKAGKKLLAPLNTPDSIYQLMLKCWTTLPSRRITFQEVRETLTNLIEQQPKGENWK